MRPRAPVFADAVWFIAHADPGDDWRQAALALDSAIGLRPLVTTDGIIQELLAHIARHGARARTRAARTARELRASRRVEVISHTAEVIESALALYDREFRYSSLSLQDCVSIHVMRERGITDILTADREFIRAGFTPLML